MSLLVILLAVALALAVLAAAPKKRSATDELLESVRRTDDEEDLARAEDEVRDLGATTTPEDAAEDLHDWGPGVPRARRRPGA